MRAQSGSNSDLLMTIDINYGYIMITSIFFLKYVNLYSLYFLLFVSMLTVAIDINSAK